MLCLNNNHHAQGLQGFLDGLANLQCHAFLHLKAVRETVDHTGNLAQAGNVSVGDVGHMHTSVERQHVVLAQGIEVDVLHNNHLAIVFLELCRIEQRHGVLTVSACERGHGTRHTLGSLEESLTRGILAHQFQYAFYMFLQFILHGIVHLDRCFHNKDVLFYRIKLYVEKRSAKGISNIR